MGHISGIPRQQLVLFPESLDEYISADNPVRFIDAFVDSLDLAAAGFTHTTLAKTGRPPYDPRDLLKLYIYGYLNRMRSSRKLEQECQRNVEVMWLLGKLAPDHKTIADFRKDNRQAFKEVFKAFCLLCRELDLFGAELIAIDGSKFKAVNSSKRNFTQTNVKKYLQKKERHIHYYKTSACGQCALRENAPATKKAGVSPAGWMNTSLKKLSSGSKRTRRSCNSARNWSNTPLVPSSTGGIRGTS